MFFISYAKPHNPFKKDLIRLNRLKKSVFMRFNKADYVKNRFVETWKGKSFQKKSNLLSTALDVLTKMEPNRKKMDKKTFEKEYKHWFKAMKSTYLKIEKTKLSFVNALITYALKQQKRGARIQKSLIKEFENIKQQQIKQIESVQALELELPK